MRPATTSDSSRRDGIVALVERHIDAVYNVAFRVLWNRADAEDVVQATFVKALTRGDQLRDRSRERPWLLQIAYREALTVLRRRRDTPTDPALLPDRPDAAAGPEQRAVADEIARRIEDALARLDTDTRMAAVLRDVEGLPVAEVAAVLGIGESAAKMRVHRARAALRPALEDLHR